jgi:hypothetical protein
MSAATAATMLGVVLVFLGAEMAPVVSGFITFHLHNDIVYRGHPSGHVPKSRFDVFFISAGLFLLLAKACNKVFHFCQSGSSGRGGFNRLSTVWSVGAQLDLR